MSIRTELEDHLKQAMKSGDDQRKRVIRMALAAIKQTEIDKGIHLDEGGLMAIIQKEIKSRRESITDAEKAHRQDLVGESQAEIAILEGYLPKSLSAEELEELARQAVQESGATSLREMGQVMKILMPRLQGRATGDQASQAVRKLLS